MSATESINGPYILGRYSIKHIVEELCKPIIFDKENAVIPHKYMYIKKLIPVVLDLCNVEYTHWSTLLRDAARSRNLLHHIDTTPPPDHNLLWCQQDAVILTWIFATISPYLLVRITSVQSNTTTAMDCWTRLRDIWQQHDTVMQKRRRKFIHIDLNQDYHDLNNYGNRVDLLSNLSDDLLIHVLSLVDDMKTAARTSILSKRWTRVWTHLTDLDFDDLRTTTPSLEYDTSAQPEMDIYVNWVNRVISAHRAPYLRTFGLHFPLNTSYAAHVDNWLKFAFSKEVRILNLNFKSCHPRIHFFKIFSTNFNTTLESLHLSSVNIQGPLLQWVLTNCLNLQRLSLHRCNTSSKHRIKLEISSPKLKHLEFIHCLKLLTSDALILSAPNLTSFIYYELQIDVEYRSVPSLVDVTLGGPYLHHLDTLSGFSSQLEKLSILWEMAPYASSRFPTFLNVQQLEIVYSQQDVYLLSVNSLIEACPLMHTFKLKLMRQKQSKSLGPDYTRLIAIRSCQHLIRSYQHLKTVEFLGYAGCAFAAELALCLTRHAPMLRRFIFDTRQPQPHFTGKPCEVYTYDHMDQMEIVRSSTELLAKQIRASQGLVDVVIL